MSWLDDATTSTVGAIAVVTVGGGAWLIRRIFTNQQMLQNLRLEMDLRREAWSKYEDRAAHRFDQLESKIDILRSEIRK